ncbi:GNAT family N-acetyltransferase [Draconibacterium halophilum]|uniref:GNAT family N-acetyltransferase n=1 Tax=Draconibacterium halophilum TaxID=2706887 RepID=UPI00193F8097|nr:GNAT family N-acetyltransferase [Draconibacterium halophilum]
MQLNTKRLILNPITINDKHAILAYRSDAEANKYQGWIPQSLEDIEVFIRKLSAKLNVPDTWFQLAVVEKTNMQIIGDIGIHFIDEHQVELGYTISKDWQGLGMATEAVKAVIDYLFRYIKKHRITASVDPRNIASFAVLEKLGFWKRSTFQRKPFDKWPMG